MLPESSKRGRPPTNPRLIIDALLYIAKAGVQWRLLPHDCPAWQTVYHVFRKWTRDHTWEALNARLRALVRESAGKRCRPTAGILDRQSVKSDPHGGVVGYDAAKRIKGRKRHLLVIQLCW
jgi:putative transposase